MIEKRDIYLRAHTVVLDGPERPEQDHPSTPRVVIPKWADTALVFSTEARTSIKQELTFGFYRVLKLRGDEYVLEEEGAFYDDGLPAAERRILEAYLNRETPDVMSCPPNFPLLPRAEFVKKVFYRCARKGALIVGFDLCPSLARLARKCPAGDRHEWSLILSEYPDSNENPHHPRVQIEPIDGKRAFIRFRAEWVQKDGKTKATDIWKSRFLDLRTLLMALFHQQLSLKGACQLETFKKYALPQPDDYTTGPRVTVAAVKHACQNVRCIATLLNAAKHEFDLHPIPLRPERAYSRASIAKGYLQAMCILPPPQKFDVPPEVLGITMESYSGGRSEMRLRHAEVPVAPVDFTSQYATVCALLELMKVLTAASLTFENATEEVRHLLKTISLDKCLTRKLWLKFLFFALVKPNGDLLPVRRMQNTFTQAIGTDYLTSDKPIWFAGPDVINSVIQTGKVPHIERAIRLVPHGKQAGLKAVRLRGAVKIDPRRDDLFRKIVEERKQHKDDKDLSHSLKILASAIYGCFVEINPEPTPARKPALVRVYSGEDTFVPPKRYDVIERQGKWYAPYLASLITAGGRLLLGMLEKCVTDVGGVHAWADTDALAVVCSDDGRSLAHIPGCENSRALTHAEVQGIIDRFRQLNPYSYAGSILSFAKDNYVDSDPEKGFRQLLGFGISAKRYTEYEREGDRITTVNPKAHGLGYLYPPADSPEGWDDKHDVPGWIYDAWEYLLRVGFRLQLRRPSWLKRPQMMRIAITAQDVLKRFNRWPGCRPYNFFLLPILTPGGYPADVNPDHFTLVAPFERYQEKWMDSVCINIDDANDDREYRLTTEFNSPEFGKRAVVDTFQNLLHRYLFHPESKSLAPTGEPCRYDTRGLLQHPHIIAGEFHRIGKETDRRWEEGDDLESFRYRPIEYEPELPRPTRYATAVASKALARQVREFGIRELMRFGCGRRTLQKICRRELVRASTLAEYESMIREYKLSRNSTE